MIFWSSSEATEEATELFRPLRKTVEAQINQSLTSVKLAPPWEGWKWAFIAIIVSKEFDETYPERIRKSSKNKVLEFRLRMEHDLFVTATPVRRLALYFVQLQRSVETMTKWKMNEADRRALSGVLKKTEAHMAEELDQRKHPID